MNQQKNDQSAKFSFLTLFSGTMSQLLEILLARLLEEVFEQNSLHEVMTIVTPNPEQLMLARRNSIFKDHLQAADVRIADGVGLVVASRLKGWIQHEAAVQARLSGIELAKKLLDMAIINDWPVLVIGGRELGTKLSADEKLAKMGVYELALRDRGTQLQQKNVWWLEGYADVTKPQLEEDERVLSVLQALKPKLLLVALGAPHQEAWLENHRGDMSKSGVGVALVVGGALDVLTGKLQAAPTWMSRSGLEWFYRLWQEPWRWRRQLALIPFIYVALKEAFRRDVKSI